MHQENYTGYARDPETSDLNSPVHKKEAKAKSE
jgi:hypothetical protein